MIKVICDQARVREDEVEVEVYRVQLGDEVRVQLREYVSRDGVELTPLKQQGKGRYAEQTERRRCKQRKSIVSTVTQTTLSKRQ